jgi:hypothetical protein
MSRRVILALSLTACAHAPAPRSGPPVVRLLVCPERAPAGVDRDDAPAVVMLEAEGTLPFRLRLGVVPNACESQAAAPPEVVHLDCRDPHGAHNAVRVARPEPGVVEVALEEFDDERATPAKLVVKERRAVDRDAIFSTRTGRGCEP